MTLDVARFLFRHEVQHDGFAYWLSAFAKENKIRVNEQILFSRDPLRPEFSRWTIAPSAKRDEIVYGAMAFGAVDL